MTAKRKMTDVCRFAGGPHERKSSMNTFIEHGVNKGTVSLIAMAALVVAAFAAKLRRALKAEVPEGYEDGSGFHLGSSNFKG
jgi:hypothetical protein